jgi:hypothetical protein
MPTSFRISRNPQRFIRELFDFVTMSSMKHDSRPVGEQVKSGFIIVGKMLAAFGIAVTILTGSALIRSLPPTQNRVTLGWLLVSLSIIVMFTTVRFWQPGSVAL